MRYTGFFCIIFLSISIFTLFKVKFYVQNLHKDIAEVQKQLVKEKTAIHVLEAEWNYLNKPERLRKLSDKYIKLEPILLKQIYQLEQGLPLYFSEDTARRELYIASNEFSQYSKKTSNHNPINRNIFRIRGIKNHHNKLTEIKY